MSLGAANALIGLNMVLAYRDHQSPLLTAFGAELLKPKRRADSIRLRLPWREERQFLVPAANPRNPVYSWRPRG